MKFQFIVDKHREEVVVYAPERTPLVEELERLATKRPMLTAYSPEKDTLLELDCTQIECITVLDGKTCLIDAKGKHSLSKRKLYELEALLPDSFYRINKSTIANGHAIVRFEATFSGGVNAVFRCGYKDYVSRRCFSQIKRRLDK